MTGSTQFNVAAVLAIVSAVNAATVDLPIIFRNTYALVETEIGTPPSNYLLMFDTGSSSAWVVDQNCAVSCPNRSGYKRVGYNESASTTATSLGAYGEIDYFGGTTSGPAVSDEFTFNSETGAALSWNQSFLAANQSNWPWMEADGFLGLAFSTIAAPDTTTVVETLMQKGLLDDHRFGIYYGKEFANTGNETQGILTIGASREDTYVDGNLTYVPLRQEAEFQVWRASVQSVTGTKSTSAGSPVTSTQTISQGRAVFDTGAGDIQVPASIISQLYESIGFNYTALMKGGYIPMCSEFNSSWSVSFTFGDASSGNASTLTLSGDQLAQPGFANNELACFPPFSESGVDGFFLFGPFWLHKFYTVWDFGAFAVSEYQPRIGFGVLKDEYKP